MLESAALSTEARMMCVIKIELFRFSRMRQQWRHLTGWFRPETIFVEEFSIFIAAKRTILVCRIRGLSRRSMS